jgi:hypothetical protein
VALDRPLACRLPDGPSNRFVLVVVVLVTQVLRRLCISEFAGSKGLSTLLRLSLLFEILRVLGSRQRLRLLDVSKLPICRL